MKKRVRVGIKFYGKLKKRTNNKILFWWNVWHKLLANFNLFYLTDLHISRFRFICKKHYHSWVSAGFIQENIVTDIYMPYIWYFFLFCIPWLSQGLIYKHCYNSIIHWLTEYPSSSPTFLAPLSPNGCKLDGVGPLITDPPKTSFTTWSKNNYNRNKWHMTCETWCTTHDTWQVGGGEPSLKFSSLALMVW